MEPTVGGDIVMTLDTEAAVPAETLSRRRKKAWARRMPSWRFRTSKPSPIITETKIQSLDETPFGYPRLAAFQSSDHNFTLYRSFSYLRSRVLLAHQYDLARLEKELNRLDLEDVETGHGKRLICQARDDRDAKKENQERSRRQILADIHHKFLEYDELLCKTREMISFQRPSVRDYRSVRTWFANTRPLVEDEEDYVRCREDIISLRHGREYAGFDEFIASILLKMDSKIIRYLFCTPELRAKTNDKSVQFLSPSRIDALVSVIITLVISILLVIPVLVLFELTSYNSRSSTLSAIGVLLVFTLVFCAAMGSLTAARRHELFAASAAYCAVLVVFVSNFSGLTEGSTAGAR